MAVHFETTDVLRKLAKDLDRIEMLSQNAASNAIEIAGLALHAKQLLNSIVIDIRI